MRTLKRKATIKDRFIQIVFTLKTDNKGTYTVDGEVRPCVDIKHKKTKKTRMLPPPPPPEKDAISKKGL